MQRTFRHDIMKEIKTRFANRALKADRIPEETIEALIEAASFAPSCFNEQPWRFLVATGERKEKLCQALTPQNQEWACRAPVLMLLCAKKTFTQGGKPNFWHLSDSGCAQGFLMLEAERRGLTAHPMAGVNRKMAREIFDIPDDLEVVDAIAIGYPGDLELLSERNRERNHPAARRDIGELML